MPSTMALGGKAEDVLSLHHLRASQVQLLLQTEGLAVHGGRDELLARFKAHLARSLPSEWVMTALEGGSMTALGSLPCPVP